MTVSQIYLRSPCAQRVLASIACVILFAGLGCGRPISAAVDSGAALRPTVAGDAGQCVTLPEDAKGVPLLAEEWPVWWLGAPQVSDITGGADLVLRAFLNDPSFIVFAGTARAALTRVHKDTVEILEAPPGTSSKSWRPLASVAAGDSIHVIWRDSATQPLLYALHVGRRWVRVGEIPGSASLDFEVLQSGGMTLHRGGVVIVARPRRTQPAGSVASGSYDWRMLRSRDGSWQISNVPSWRHEPFYVALTAEPSGLSLIGLIPSLPGFAWATRFLPNEAEQFGSTVGEYSLGPAQGMSKVVSSSHPSGTVVVSAMAGSTDSIGSAQKTLLANRFVAGNLRQADSLSVESDLALFDVASFGADQPVIFAVFSDGSATMHVGTLEGEGPVPPRLTWKQHRLPGRRHIAIPVLRRFGDEVWLYASEASGATDRGLEGATLEARAYQLRCDGLP